jgi:protein ImuA
MAGPVLWAYPAWQADRLHPPGLAAFADPHRLILAAARRPEDVQWALEEGLRSGAVPLCIAEWPGGPPGLTAVRRLHLAAEGGAPAAQAAGRPAALGVILTPGDGGAAGVETRWHMAPLPPDGPPAPWGDTPAPLWQLDRLRARDLPPAAWRVQGVPPRLL